MISADTTPTPRFKYYHLFRNLLKMFCLTPVTLLKGQRLTLIGYWIQQEL